MSVNTLNSHLVPAVIAWLREQDDKVYVQFALHSFDSGMSPVPRVPFGSFEIPVNGVPGKDPFTLEMLVLNIDYESVNAYQETETGLMFQCRMSGQVTEVFINYNSITRLECPRLKVGYDFPHAYQLIVEEKFSKEDNSQPADEPTPPVKTGRPNLTVVK